MARKETKYAALVRDARACIGQSDAALWRLAELTARGVKEASVTDWAKDIGYTEARTRTLVRLWQRYGRRRVKGLSYSDHLTLARMKPDTAEALANDCVAAGKGVWQLRKERLEARYSDEPPAPGPNPVRVALNLLRAARDGLTGCESFSTHQRNELTQEVELLVALERTVNQRRRKLRIA